MTSSDHDDETTTILLSLHASFHYTAALWLAISS